MKHEDNMKRRQKARHDPESSGLTATNQGRSLCCT